MISHTHESEETICPSCEARFRERLAGLIAELLSIPSFEARFELLGELLLVVGVCPGCAADVVLLDQVVYERNGTRRHTCAASH